MTDQTTVSEEDFWALMDMYQEVDEAIKDLSERRKEYRDHILSYVEVHGNQSNDKGSAVLNAPRRIFEVTDMKKFVEQAIKTGLYSALSNKLSTPIMKDAIKSAAQQGIELNHFRAGEAAPIMVVKFRDNTTKAVAGKT